MQFRDDWENSDADGPGVAVGSYVSCLPGVIGVLGVLSALVAAWRRKRRTRT